MGAMALPRGSGDGIHAGLAAEVAALVAGRSWAMPFDRGSVSFRMLELPRTFTHEGNGAHAALLKKGAPENSIEAKTCLMGGKKLKEAKITFALDEQSTWSFGIEADQFLFRGLKLPQGEGQLDAVSRFQERMVFMEQWRDIFLDLYGAFVTVRADSKKWKNTLSDIREWVKGRPGRR